MASSRDSDESGNATDCAGDCHRANHDVLDIDRRITRGVLAFANDRNLISLLAIAQVKIHQDCDGENNDHVECIHLPEQRRKPTRLCCGVDDADCVGAKWILPFCNEETC
ncbi:hypothetical protein SDC9_140133 [bioreactor metagenome]|uniref:Uncharacterized protein n=1 Tax=bioreactor metagenome TaxID=1076179 RepID=A0A645DUD9_9ZZZZ